jgi:MFS transporter, DHA1 family, inner membrane transport protein
MLNRLLDDSFDKEIRRNITAVTVARLVANAAYRFAPLFLATIARGFDVSLSTLGFAIFVSELSGFASPFAGRIVDRLTHRNSMVLGLIGSAVGCTIAAVSTSPLMFAVGVTVLALTKQSFDLGLGAWIADHVPYNQRGKIVGLTETAWALGLLVGVSIMGLITAATNWRIGFAFAVLCLVVSMFVIFNRVTNEARVPHESRSTTPQRITGNSWLVVFAMFCIMCSAQNLFVTFGAWLEDEFQFGAARLAVAGFSLGLVELVASVSSSRQTDKWGKERSIALGALLVIPGGIFLCLGSNNLIIGLIGVFIYFLGFEFSVVSLLPLATSLVPNSPGTGLGWVLGAGTLGRAVMAIIATHLFESFGVQGPALMGAFFGLLGALTITYYRRLNAKS